MTRLAPFATLLCLSVSAVANASPPYDKERYEAEFDLRTGDDEDQIHLKSCLKAWGTHPFGEEERYTARFFESNVRVMGIGQEMRDRRVGLMKRLFEELGVSPKRLRFEYIGVP
ncbi:MAG: hypothetical protein JRJ84_21425, partial [Deltaproteobacteria bacterium]|nr:hypothetical protein [Deltaproteobacteria bacterium]